MKYRGDHQFPSFTICLVLSYFTYHNNVVIVDGYHANNTLLICANLGSWATFRSHCPKIQYCLQNVTLSQKKFILGLSPGLLVYVKESNISNLAELLA